MSVPPVPECKDYSRSDDQSLHTNTTGAVRRALAALDGFSTEDLYVQGFLSTWVAAVRDPGPDRWRATGRILLAILGLAACIAGLAGTLPLAVAVGGLLISGLALWPPRAATHLGRTVHQARCALDQGHISEAFKVLNGAMSSDRARAHPEICLATCALWPALPAQDPLAGAAGLRLLLRALSELPEEAADGAINLAAMGDEEREIALLVEIGRDTGSGVRLGTLRSRALDLALQRARDGRSDAETMELLRSLTAYGISVDVANWLLADALARRGGPDDLHEAERLLTALSGRAPSPDTLYLLAGVQRRLGRPEPEVLASLVRFAKEYPLDERAGGAWKDVGDIYANAIEGDGMAAVEAYLQAEAHGLQVAALLAYRAGDWDPIPALRTHSDYAFPVVVALDIEVDPALGAAPGERVFEVGAARVKGRTVLDTYQSFVRRDFVPSKSLRFDLSGAPTPQVVARQLDDFIRDCLVAGHNISDFDAVHLRAMGCALPVERLLDTLHLGRLLYPDSIRHNLDLLCMAHHIPLEANSRHTALADAVACAALLHALGDELVGRGGALLAGVRALAKPGSLLDWTVLCPRGAGADPQLSWELDPAPGPTRVLADTGRDAGALRASPALVEALRSGGDALVEIDDPVAGYAAYLSPEARCLVAVGSRAKLECVLAARHGGDAGTRTGAIGPGSQSEVAGSERGGTYVLPDPRTLLCPSRIRSLIETLQSSGDLELCLSLFCLYQASHNHDAATLYPLRIPSEDQVLRTLRETLERATCPDDVAHRASCPGHVAAEAAKAGYRVLVSTHQALLAQPVPPLADMVVIDDVDTLPTGLALWSAQRVGREDLVALGPAGAAALLIQDQVIRSLVDEYLPNPRYHERLP